MTSRAFMGLFADEDGFLEAARKLKESGAQDISVMSPIPVHGVEEAIGERPNRVRYFSLGGALLGGFLGFAMAAATALVFILPTGGRPVIPFPPYMVIAYEMTILIGVLATLLGFHVVSGLPAWRDAPYTTELNVDRFAVVVPDDGSIDRERVEKIFREAGAVEVRQWEPEDE